MILVKIYTTGTKESAKEFADSIRESFKDQKCIFVVIPSDYKEVHVEVLPI